mgnify:CR=1 FL=1
MVASGVGGGKGKAFFVKRNPIVKVVAKHTDCFGSPKYAKQVAEYMSLLADTSLYNHIEGYVWYLMTGELECVEQ